MATCFWAILLVLPVQANGQAALKVQRCRTLAGRLTGLALGCFIHKGMTTSQVRRILGEQWSPYKPLGMMGSTGGCVFATWNYHHFGLWVGFFSGPGEDLKVTRISFFPLFD
jgi:hypothetical protein